MRLWVSRETPVPIHQQLVTQLVLGIMSGDLIPGQRLPSVRALARTVNIHSNTVSAAYGELGARGWAQSRKGSGVYVRVPDERRGLPESLARYIAAARQAGLTPAEIHAAVDRAIAPGPPRVVVLDAEPEFARIVAAELCEAGFDARAGGGTEGAVVAVMTAREQALSTIAAGTPSVVLRLRSVAAMLGGEQRPPREMLVAVVSASATVRDRAHAILIAAGIDPDALLVCDSSEAGWRRRLAAAHLCIADICAAARLRKQRGLREFRIVAESSIAELRAMLPAL